jgi:predicted Rdx family selenoprotein
MSAVCRASFEVTIDEKIIFSRLVEGEYPEPVALMRVCECLQLFVAIWMAELFLQAVVDYVRFGRLPKRVRTDTPRCAVS